MTHEPTMIQSVRRALQLLDEVADTGEPASAKALARRTGIPLATTYHLLRTMVHEGYLERLDGLGYVLGTKVGELAGTASGSTARTVHQHDVLRALHEETAAAAYLSVLRDGELHLVEVVDSPAAPRVALWAGLEASAHATALGKALLAAIDPVLRQDYLACHPLADLTPRTVTDPRVLLHELAGSVDLAVDRGEYALGTACIAAAVALADGPVAVAVSVPTHRLSHVADGRAVRRAAHRLALGVTI